MPEPSRRRALAAGGLVAGGAVAAGILGAGAGLLWPGGASRARTTPVPTVPPAGLTRALAREDGLIATLDAAAAVPALAARARLLRRDHAAHAQALRAVLARYPAADPGTASASTPTTTAAGPPTLAVLRSAETSAARDTASDGAGLHGPDDAALAALLASIAACEATHAAWLT